MMTRQKETISEEVNNIFKLCYTPGNIEQGLNFVRLIYETILSNDHSANDLFGNIIPKMFDQSSKFPPESERALIFFNAASSIKEIRGQIYNSTKQEILKKEIKEAKALIQRQLEELQSTPQTSNTATTGQEEKAADSSSSPDENQHPKTQTWSERYPSRKQGEVTAKHVRFAVTSQEAAAAPRGK